MGMLASGAFAPKHRGPALVRLLVPGSRLLLIASETVQICQIHFTGERTVPCPGVPLCEHHEKFRTVNYGYVYCRVENTTWDVTVAEKDRVPVDPPWCIHELTEPV